MNFLRSRSKKFNDKARKLALKEEELRQRELKDKEEERQREIRNEYLRAEAAKKLAADKIALAEAQLEAEAKKARKDAEKLRRNAALQERQRLVAESNLWEQQQQNEELRIWIATNMSRLSHEAKLEVEEQKRKKDEEIQRLQDQLALEEARRLQHEDDVLRAEEEERKRIRELKEAQDKLEQKLKDQEKMRQRDEVRNSNSPKALRELRELIRARYELDMDIWNSRNDFEANRDIVKKKMFQSNAILQDIQSRVQKWSGEDGASGWTPEEWQLAQEVKTRLLAPGKRDWDKEPLANPSSRRRVFKKKAT
jgi:hypothetical protein